VLHRFDGLAVFTNIFIRAALANNLFASLRTLALGKQRKVFGGDGPGKAKARRKLALPLTLNNTALRPIEVVPVVRTVFVFSLSGSSCFCF
jgi:hypothetical protein